MPQVMGQLSLPSARWALLLSKVILVMCELAGNGESAQEFEVDIES
jgi:hypothetical protein